MTNLIISLRKRLLICLCVLVLPLPCSAQRTAKHPLGQYLGAIEGQKSFFSYYSKNKSKFHKRVTIECQEVKRVDEHMEALFVRTFYDEPQYLAIYSDKILDDSLGGVILYTSSRSGDIINIRGKKTGKTLACIKVVSIDEPFTLEGKVYDDCIVLDVFDYQTDTKERRVYAYGIGLIYEEDYIGTSSPTLEGKLILNHYFKPQSHWP